MKWSQEKSIVLSKVSVILFFVLYLAVLIVCSDIARYNTGVSSWLWLGLSERYINFLCRVVYICAIPLGLILIILYRLLQSIGEEQIFTADNISRLRQISWLCILLALVCAGAALRGTFFIFIAASAALMAILLRVIKNIFERAKELKEENDFTI